MQSESFFIGTSGWSYPDWKGIVYPRSKPAHFSELSYIARHFNAVEINSTFYRPPAAKTTATWLSKVEKNADFIFTAKLWQRFTHERDTVWTESEVDRFKEGLRPLCEAEKLGALLMQFPFSFSATRPNVDWLIRLSDAFTEFPLTVEVRHESWCEAGIQEIIKRQRLSFCNIDQPYSGKGIGNTNFLTGGLGYYRFHGRNQSAWFDQKAGRDERYNYLYDEATLAPWVKKIAAAKGKVSHIFVMLNNHYRGQAFVNALQFTSRLSGKKVVVPSPLLEHYPILKRIAAPSPEQRFLDF